MASSPQCCSQRSGPGSSMVVGPISEELHEGQALPYFLKPKVSGLAHHLHCQESRVGDKGNNPKLGRGGIGE